MQSKWGDLCIQLLRINKGKHVKISTFFSSLQNMDVITEAKSLTGNVCTL